MPRHGHDGPSLRRLLAAILAGAVVLGSLAALVAGTSDPVHTARATLALRPDPVVNGDVGTPISATDSNIDTFLQTELVYLNSAQLAGQVQDRLSLDTEPDIDATRVQQSSVVEILTSGTDPDRTLAQADAAATTYAERRLTAANDRLNAQLATVDAQIAEVLSALNSPENITIDTEPDAELLALQSRYQDLLALSGTIQLAQSRASEGVSIIGLAALTPQGGVQGPVAWGLVGALLGAVGGASLLLLRRRLGSQIARTADLDDVGAPVMEPALPRGPHDWPRTMRSEVESPLRRAARLQAVQLVPDGGKDDPTVLVLLGTTAGVGTSFVALQHAALLARRSPTLLLCAGAVATGGDSTLSSALDIDPNAPGLGQLADRFSHDPARAGSSLREHLSELVRETSVPGLLVLPSGVTRDGAFDNLEHLVEHGLLEAARELGWSLVIDAPPLDRSTAGLQLARRAGRAALVAGIKVSTPEDVVNGVRILTAAGVDMLGVVLDSPLTRGATHRRRPAPVPAVGRDRAPTLASPAAAHDTVSSRE